MGQKIPRNILYVEPLTALRAIASLLGPSALNGPARQEFEKSVAGFIGARGGISVSSGTAALYLCLKSLGAQEGDQVLLSDFNVPEVPALLVAMGLVPVLVDIDPDSFNINPGLVEKAINKHTKFLLVTHMFGAPARIGQLVSIANRHAVAVIEDACQAFGAQVGDKKAGAIAPMGYYSFGSLKTLSAFGGGFIVSDNAQYIQTARSLLDNAYFTARSSLLREITKTLLIKAFTNRCIFSWLTYPGLRLCSARTRRSIFQGKRISVIPASGLPWLARNFTHIQALAGMRNLSRVPAELERIRTTAKCLDALLTDLGIPFQQVQAEDKGAYFKYVIRVPKRDRFLNRLFACGVDATYGYMGSCAAIQEFRRYSHGCPESMRLEQEHVYLPIHSLRSEADIDFLADALRKSL